MSVSLLMTLMTHIAIDSQNAAMQQAWDKAAAGWNSEAALIHTWLAQPTALMLEAANIQPGARVLDVAAGAGDQTLDIARRVGPAGQVLATDLSARILEFAEQNAQREGFLNIETAVANAQELDLHRPPFDAAVCRLGLMFCDDPNAALRAVHQSLKPQARFAALVFSGAAHNPCIAIMMQTALKHAGLPAAKPDTPGGLLSLGGPGVIEQLFVQAGFGDVQTVRLPAPMRLPSVQRYVDFVRSSGSPIIDILHRLAPAARDAAWADMARQLSRFSTPTGWEGPNQLLLCSGQA